MVNEIDDNGLDHVGWALWKATAAWKRCFDTAMRDAGYPAFAEARGAILMHVGPQGIGQRELVALTGLTKQAVQQALERLEDEDLIRRSQDPGDARRLIVSRTEAGQAAFKTADDIKCQIQTRIEADIGTSRLREIHSAMAQIAALLSTHGLVASEATPDQG